MPGRFIGPVGGHISVGAKATLLSSHAGRSFSPSAGNTAQRQPQEDGRRKVSQTPGDPEQTTATRRLSHRHTHLAAHTTPTLRRKGPPFRAEMGCFCVCSAQVQEVAKNEPPRHVRRLQFLERMGSCQVVHRGGTRRSCVSGRCGWSQRSAVSTIRSGQRSVRSPVYLVLAARRRCVSGCARRRSMPAHGPGPRPKNPLS